MSFPPLLVSLVPGLGQEQGVHEVLIVRRTALPFRVVLDQLRVVADVRRDAGLGAEQVREALGDGR